MAGGVRRRGEAEGCEASGSTNGHESSAARYGKRAAKPPSHIKMYWNTLSIKGLQPCPRQYASTRNTHPEP